MCESGRQWSSVNTISSARKPLSIAHQDLHSFYHNFTFLSFLSIHHSLFNDFTVCYIRSFPNCSLIISHLQHPYTNHGSIQISSRPRHNILWWSTLLAGNQFLPSFLSSVIQQQGIIASLFRGTDQFSETTIPQHVVSLPSASTATLLQQCANTNIVIWNNPCSFFESKIQAKDTIFIFNVHYPKAVQSSEIFHLQMQDVPRHDFTWLLLCLWPLPNNYQQYVGPELQASLAAHLQDIRSHDCDSPLNQC